MGDTVRELLDIAAEYVEAKQAAELAEGFGGRPVADLDEIAARWEAKLAKVIAR